jgi:hypothetical protein
LSDLYEKFHYHEFIRPALGELEREVNAQKSKVTAKTEEFFDLLNRNRFYLGETLSSHLIWYVRLISSTISGEQSAAGEAKEFAKMLEDPVKWPIVENEEYRKEKEKSISERLQSLAEYRKSIEESTSKLRFGYSAARQYSLQRRP